MEDMMPLPFVIKVPAAEVYSLRAPRRRSARVHGDAAAAALVQPHEWCNGAGGAALLYMVVRDDWLAPSAPGTA